MFSPSPVLNYVVFVLWLGTSIVDGVRAIGFSSRKGNAIRRLLVNCWLLVGMLWYPVELMELLPLKLFFLTLVLVVWFFIKYNLFRFSGWFEPVISRSEGKIVDKSLIYMEEPIEIPDRLFKAYAVLRIVIVIEGVAIFLVVNIGRSLVEVGWL
ncbi:MAG: hypothetical protein ACTSPB_00440 [Candidatus Thorarchaeota archaeon]